MLNFNRISKTFKSDLLTQPFTALSDVSFSIPEGSMVGFLGANGAGKTTSIKIIMDFIRADSGTVEFDPRLGKSKIEVFKHIGFLPERPYFYPNLTGREFLMFMGQLSEMSTSSIEDGIKKWASRFKIEHALARPLRTYSKGMLQRIGFLATILHEPRMIILDEPLSGLDPIGRKELKDVIVEVHRDGKTVFFSSHIVPDIEEICDRVIFLKEGKLIYDGLVDQLLKSGQKNDFIVKINNDVVPSFSTETKKIDKLPGNIINIVVAEDKKEKLISEIISSGLGLVGLELIKPSLEEIFYSRKTE